MGSVHLTRSAQGHQNAGLHQADQAGALSPLTELKPMLVRLVPRVVRGDIGYHTDPLSADFAAAVRTPFPAHRHSVVAAHRRIGAERDNDMDLGLL
jgi:hypothetical protein